MLSDSIFKRDSNAIGSAFKIRFYPLVVDRARGVKRIAGVILDGATRDIESIEETGPPCFARSLISFNVQTRSETIGNDCQICCGDALVNPGDLIVGDRDGVVVVPMDLVDSEIEEGNLPDRRPRDRRAEKRCDVPSSTGQIQ